MSGGSYEYICFAEIEQLIAKQHEIQRMADRLAGLGYAPDAAKATQNLLLDLRKFENRIEAARAQLQGVWKAVEWWDSADSGEKELEKALEDYRGGDSLIETLVKQQVSVDANDFREPIKSIRLPMPEDENHFNPGDKVRVTEWGGESYRDERVFWYVGLDSSGNYVLEDEKGDMAWGVTEIEKVDNEVL